MSSINGVSLKNIKDFYDHEGLLIYQGDVYIDGKLAGHWSMDYMNGPDMYRFDIDELSKRTMKFAKGIPADKVQYPTIYEDTDIFLWCLLKLQQDEDYYRKIMSSGYKSLAIIDDKQGDLCHVRSKGVLTEEDLQEYTVFKRRDDYRIYKRISDFCIVIDEDNPAPVFLYKE